MDVGYQQAERRESAQSKPSCFVPLRSATRKVTWATRIRLG